MTFSMDRDRPENGDLRSLWTARRHRASRIPESVKFHTQRSLRPSLTAACCAALTFLAEPRLAAQSPGVSCASVAALGSTKAPAPSRPTVIPFTLRQNHVAITVCRGGKAFTFLLDTGAGSSNFDLSTAKEAGITLGAPLQIRGAGTGSVAGARIEGESVGIPGTGIALPVTLAVDYSGLAAAAGTAPEGLIGADFVARYVVAVDYRRQTLTLYDRESFAYSGTGAVVPISFSGAFIRVPADITLADGSALKGNFVVDVGSGLPLVLSTHFVSDNHLRDRIGTTVYRPGGRGVGGVTMVDVGRIAKLSIGGLTLSRVITMLHSETAGAFANPALGDGNIGGDILRHFLVYFDYGRRQLILEPHEDTAEPFETDMSGLQLSLGANRTVLAVDFVVAQSPAAEAGLVRGDEVTAVDGVAVTPGMLDELRIRLRTAGQHIAFTISRASGSVVVRVVTRRIV